MIKRISTQLIFAILGLASFGILACSSDSGSTPDVKPTVKTLTVNVSSIDFITAGSSSDITVTTNVDTWTISTSDSSWIQLSRTSGPSGSTSVSVTASANTSTTARTAKLTVSSTQAASVIITVNQAGVVPPTADMYPSYNTNPIAADATGMSSSAVQLAAKIKLGWNIGNTLEATGGETAWGNPKVNKALIDLVKEGFFYFCNQHYNKALQSICFK